MSNAEEYICKNCGACFQAEKPICTCCKSDKVQTVKAVQAENKSKAENHDAKPKPK